MSLLKHETLVITTAAVKRLEERIVSHLKRAKPSQSKFCYIDWKDQLLREAGEEFTPNADEQAPFV